MTAVRKVLLVENHLLMLEALKDLLEENRELKLSVASRARDGATAVSLAKKEKPDLVLMDIGLPRMDGIEATRLIKNLSNPPIVLIFSEHEDRDHVVRAIRAGADDYIFKSNAADTDILQHIVRAFHKKDPAHGVIWDWIRAQDEKNISAGITRLTGMELEVLRRAAYQGMTAKEIAKSIGHMVERTVQRHIEEIKTKLSARTITHAVALAIKYGFISADETSIQDDLSDS